MVYDPNRPKPGLRAIHEGREARQRGKYNRPSGAVWLVGLGSIVASLVVYKIVNGHQLDVAKRDLISGQRAMASTVGQEWAPLRDQIEKYTLASAKKFEGDFVDSEAARWDFRSAPGIYLRMRVADANDVDTLRKAAAEGQKDGFTGCFLREQNAALTRGEADAGAFAEQPWNLRQAYQATRVLSDGWIDGVKGAENAMEIRVYEEQLKKASREDMKTAADVVKKAQFFLLVLDEDDDAAKAEVPDGGPIDEAALQLVPHAARVHVLDLRTKAELLRVRRTASASFVMAGEHAVTDPETRNAMQRQVNNCALANAVKAAIAEKNADAGSATHQ